MISLICFMLYAIGTIDIKNPDALMFCMIVEMVLEAFVPVFIDIYKEL